MKHWVHCKSISHPPPTKSACVRYWLCINLVFAFFGAIWLFSRLIWSSLLVTTWQPCFLGCLSLCVPSGVASPQIWGGQSFWLKASNSILFSTPPLKAQNDKKRYKFGRNGPLGPLAYAYARTHAFFSGRWVVFVLEITNFFRPSTNFLWPHGMAINSIFK